MIYAILIILLLSFGGFAITYLIDDEGPMLWRLGAGCVIGSAVFGAAAFLLAMLFGLNAAIVALSLLITLLPLALLMQADRRKVFAHDRAKAKGKLQGASVRKLVPFFYYLFFFVLFVVFFDRAMFVNEQGIFTGGSQNLGDLPFHLGIIFGFVDGANFPPQNPSFAGAKLSYPFVPDLITAAFVKLGIGLRESLLVQNVAWAFSLLVILENFVFRLVNDRLAAKAAPALLFFSGGLGFLWFFSDLAGQSKGIIEFIGQLPKDYTISSEFRWGNSLVTLFLTQRSLLLGMPLTLVILGGLWKIFATESTERSEKEGSSPPLLHFSTPLLLGLLAGLLPLIHLHSLFVLFIVTGFLLFMRLDLWRKWLVFGIGVCVVAIPELIWSVSGSASHAAEFFQFHFGWDSGKTNIIWFWIKNTGLFITLLAFGLYIVYAKQARSDTDKKTEKKERNSTSIRHPKVLLKFYIPFAFLFVLANLAKLAPWEWDNIKVLIYWFVGSLPFAAFALAWMWHRSTVMKFVAAACFLILIFSGGLDVWRTASGQINYKVFDAEAAVLANRLKTAIAPNALILNAPTYNTAAVLTGRQSLMRYPGHLSSHGIDYRQREADVKQIYRGGPDAVALMQKYGIEYVLVSPEERNSLSPNEAFFAQFPVIAEAGRYKIYDVRKANTE